MRARWCASLAVAAAPAFCAANAFAFEPLDVVICSPSSEIRDPEIHVKAKMVAFADVSMRLKVAHFRGDATLGRRGCAGTIIDTGLTIALPGITFRNGPEWGRSAEGDEIYYAKVGDQGQPRLARAFPQGDTWVTEFLPQGDQRQFPVATMNEKAPYASLFYWRLNDDLTSTTLWRDEAFSPATEREFPGFVGPDTGGAPRWVPGQRAVTTVVPDDSGVMQAARYFIDEDRLEIMTTDAGNKDEVWMWKAPEFGNARVFSTVVDGCCVRIYRDTGASWTLVHSFAATDFSAFGRIYSPEPFTYEGKSYLAMQVALTQRYGPSNIWITAIDPANPLYRQVNASTASLEIRNEPEWYADKKGAYVFYTHVTAGGFEFRRAATGL